MHTNRSYERSQIALITFALLSVKLITPCCGLTMYTSHSELSFPNSLPIYLRLPVYLQICLFSLPSCLVYLWLPVWCLYAFLSGVSVPSRLVSLCLHVWCHCLPVWCLSAFLSGVSLPSWLVTLCLPVWSLSAFPSGVSSLCLPVCLLYDLLWIAVSHVYRSTWSTWGARCGPMIPPTPPSPRSFSSRPSRWPSLYFVP